MSSGAGSSLLPPLILPYEASKGSTVERGVALRRPENPANTTSTGNVQYQRSVTHFGLVQGKYSRWKAQDGGRLVEGEGGEGDKGQSRLERRSRVQRVNLSQSASGYVLFFFHFAS